MTSGLKPLGWLPIYIVAGAALGYLGPYGTYRDYSLPARLTYWMALAPVVGLVTQYSTMMFARTRPGMSWPILAQALAGAVIGGFPATFATIFLQYLFDWQTPITAMGLARLYGSVTVILALLGTPLTFVRKDRARPAAPVGPMPARAPVEAPSAPVPAAERQEETAPPRTEGSPFLRRISQRLGTDLLHVAAEDHYLRVTTTLGSELVLYRFSDAIAELDPALGQRVHRSSWVAQAAVQSVERADGRTTLVLRNGDRVTVSQSYLMPLRRAGWL